MLCLLVKFVCLPPPPLPTYLTRCALSKQTVLQNRVSFLSPSSSSQELGHFWAWLWKLNFLFISVIVWQIRNLSFLWTISDLGSPIRRPIVGINQHCQSDQIYDCNSKLSIFLSLFKCLFGSILVFFPFLFRLNKPFYWRLTFFLLLSCLFFVFFCVAL